MLGLVHQPVAKERTADEQPEKISAAEWHGSHRLSRGRLIAVGTTYDDLPGHEGYAARRLPDRTLTASWTSETATFDSYVPRCECGWTGEGHDPTEEGYDEAVNEWDRRHAQPLLARAVPPAVADLIASVKSALEQLAEERPLAAAEALGRLGRWADAAAARLRGRTLPAATHPEKTAHRTRRR